MDRRRYLAALGAGALGALAGCTGRGLGRGPGAGTATDTPTPEEGTVGRTPTGEFELPIPESEITRVLDKDRIPAITEPAFGPDWGQTDFELTDDDQIIGVERDGEARAYPMRILDWHEVVNDTFAGPLLVTFCPLCGSGVTGVREVNGQETQFGVSGRLWMSDLVMYDDLTDSLWSQILAQAIRGPETGDRIELVPSTLTTLGAWREEHPETSVLLPPPISGTVGESDGVRDYGRDPYDGYENIDRIGVGYNDFEDDRLHPKTLVIGIENGDAARAYPFPQVESAGGVVNDTVGGLPVVVATDPGDSLVAYERTVEGETLGFERVDARHLRAGGSRWRVVSGRAVDGPFEGSRLTRANDVSPEFWFAWAQFHPQTTVYGQDG
jgi:hypothetical protein